MNACVCLVLLGVFLRSGLHKEGKERKGGKEEGGGGEGRRPVMLVWCSETRRESSCQLNY